MTRRRKELGKRRYRWLKRLGRAASPGQGTTK